MKIATMKRATDILKPKETILEIYSAIRAVIS